MIRKVKKNFLSRQEKLEKRAKIKLKNAKLQ